MKRSLLFGSPSIHRHKLVGLTAAMMVVGTWGSIQACDHCDHGGIACDSACNSSCDSGCDSCGSCRPACPLFKAMDKFAIGVEKFLGFDKCGSSCGCDCACDAAVIDNVLIPVQPGHPQPHHHYQPAPAIPTVPPEIYSAPAPDIEAAEPYAEPIAPEPEAQPEPTVPVPGPEPQPLPDIEPNQQREGSIFDTLNDPFGDDEVRRTPNPHYLRPSSHQSRTQAQAQRVTTWRPLGSANRPVHKSHHQHARSQRSPSSSVKHTAAQRFVKRTGTSQRSNIPRTVRHQHSRTRQVQHMRQVQLSAAPKPQAQRLPLRDPIDLRNSGKPTKKHGHTTSDPSADYFAR